MKRHLIFAAAIFTLVFALTGHAKAYHSVYVTMNGVPIAPHEIPILEQLFGMHLENGHYWFNPASGMWGVAGGPALGHIRMPPASSPAPRNPASGPQKRGGYKLQTPWGNVRIDGDCFSYENNEGYGFSMPGC